MRLLVVRYLAFAVAQALIRARGSSGALCATGAGRCSVSASVLRSGVRERVRSRGTD